MMEPKKIKDDTKKTKDKISKPGLGLRRIRTIMKSTADTGLKITHEGLFLMAKATETFIQHLTKSAFKSSKSDSLNYDDIANLVNDDDRLNFLSQVLPIKITVKEFKEILNQKSAENSDSSTWEDEDDEDIPNKKSKK